MSSYTSFMKLESFWDMTRPLNSYTKFRENFENIPHSFQESSRKSSEHAQQELRILRKLQQSLSNFHNSLKFANFCEIAQFSFSPSWEIHLVVQYASRMKNVSIILVIYLPNLLELWLKGLYENCKFYEKLITGFTKPTKIQWSSSILHISESLDTHQGYLKRPGNVRQKPK